jgi:hypothetical protein
MVVYYVMALALFASDGYEEVMRRLVQGLAWTARWRGIWRVPSSPAISKARSRLGPEVLAALFDRACVPVATPGTPGAFSRSWRLVAVDGSTFDVPAPGRPGHCMLHRGPLPSIHPPGQPRSRGGTQPRHRAHPLARRISTIPIQPHQVVLPGQLGRGHPDQKLTRTHTPGALLDRPDRGVQQRDHTKLFHRSQPRIRRADPHPGPRSLPSA